MKASRDLQRDVGVRKGTLQSLPIGALPGDGISRRCGDERVPSRICVGGIGDNAAAKQLLGVPFVGSASVHIENLDVDKAQEFNDFGGGGIGPRFGAPGTD